MKISKKIICVLLSAIMIATSVSVGIFAGAAETDLDKQYGALAEYLADDWVKTKDHYEVSHKKAKSSLQDVQQYVDGEPVYGTDGEPVYEPMETNGFNSDAHSFIYVHTVTAIDNEDKSILKAANRFYSIFETIKSTEYGDGLYSPDLLYNEVIDRLDEKFEGMDMHQYYINGADVSVRYDLYEYVDFYGKPVIFGTPADVAAGRASFSYYDFEAYNDLLDSILDGSYNNPLLLTAANMPSEKNNYFIPDTVLSEARLYFRHVNAKDYYDYETIIQYFMGTCTLANSGNWFHKFYFIDTTDLDSAILEYGGLKPGWSQFDNLTAVYSMSFDRTFDADTGTKAQFSFSASHGRQSMLTEMNEYLPEIYAKVMANGDYAPFNTDLAYTKLGKASDFIVTSENTTSSVRYNILADAVTYFADGASIWSKIPTWTVSTNADLSSDPDAIAVVSKYNALTDYYDGFSADVLNAVFTEYEGDGAGNYTLDGDGNRIVTVKGSVKFGNIANLAELAQPNTVMPSRVVRDGSYYDGTPKERHPYTVDEARIASFITSFDALMNNAELGETVRQFLPTTSNMFQDSPIFGQGYNTPKQLIQLILKSLVYNGKIVNMLMELIYPKVCGLLEELPDNAYYALKDYEDGNFITNTAAHLLAGTARSLLKSVLSGVVDRCDIYLTPGDFAQYMLAPELDAHPNYTTVYNILRNAGSSWDGVNWDEMDWALDGTAEDFSSAMSLLLCGFRQLLAAVLTTQDLNLTGTIGTDAVNLGHANIQHLEAYNELIVPLFRTLGLVEYSNYNQKPYASYTGDDNTDWANANTPIDSSWWNGRYLSYQMYLEHTYLKLGRIEGGSFTAKKNSGGYDNGNCADCASEAIVNDILGPIIWWLENKLINDPINTITDLLPNLAYFVGGKNGNTALTRNLNGVLESVELKVRWGTIITFWHKDIKSLASLDFPTINSIIEQFINLDFDTDIADDTHKQNVAFYENDSDLIDDAGYSGARVLLTESQAYRNMRANKDYRKLFKNGTDTVYVNQDPSSTSFNINTVQASLTVSSQYPYKYERYWKPVAYSNGTASFYLNGTAELQEHSDTYTTPLYVVWSDTDPESDDFDITTANFSRTQSDTFSYEYRNYYTKVYSYKLPMLQDQKIMGEGTPYPSSSPLYGRLETTQDNRSRVLLYILRFALGALQSRYLDSSDSFMPRSTLSVGGWSSSVYMPYSLIECFGLDLDKVIFNGLTIGDIIYNVNYHADETICAIMMIFENDEKGNLYKNVKDLYPILPVDYYDDTLLDPEINPTRAFGNPVEYSRQWTKKDANYLVNTVDTLVDSVLAILKVNGMEGGLDGMIANLVNNFINDSLMGELLSLVFGNLYKLTNGMVDLDTVVRTVFGGNMSPAYAAAQFRDQIAQRMQGKWGVTRANVEAGDFYRYMNTESAETWGDVFYPIEYVMNSDGTYATRIVIDDHGNEVEERIPVHETDYMLNSDGERITNADGEYILTDKVEYHYTSDGSIERDLNGNPIEYPVYAHTLVNWATATEDYCEANGVSSVSFGYIKVVKDETGKVTEIKNPLRASYGGREINVENFGSFGDLGKIVLNFNLELTESMICAVFSPLSVVIDYLLYDRDLTIFDLIHIPSYAGYYYAIAPLFDALSIDAASYNEVYANTVDKKLAADGSLLADSPDVRTANRNSFYYLLHPIVALAEQIIDNPIRQILSKIPNIMFFASIGGISDIINNLVQPGYVLLDAFKPIINAYDMINGLLANLNFGSFSLNLSVPLDIDVNQFLNSLLSGLLGETVTVAKDEATGAELHLALPYIDLSTLCAGTLIGVNSIPQNSRYIVKVDDVSNGDLFTAAFRIITEILYMPKNAQNVAEYLEIVKSLDGFDMDTLTTILDVVQTWAAKNYAADYLLKFVVTVMRYVMPTVRDLGNKFDYVDFNVADLFTSAANGVKDNDFTELLEKIDILAKTTADPNADKPVEQNAKDSWWARLIEMIKKIIESIKNLFGIGQKPAEDAG